MESKTSGYLAPYLGQGILAVMYLRQLQKGNILHIFLQIPYIQRKKKELQMHDNHLKYLFPFQIKEIQHSKWKSGPEWVNMCLYSLQNNNNKSNKLTFMPGIVLSIHMHHLILSQNKTPPKSRCDHYSLSTEERIKT